MCDANQALAVSGRADLTHNFCPVTEVAPAFGQFIVASQRIEGTVQVETALEIWMFSLETGVEVGDDHSFPCITKLPSSINLTTIDIPLMIPIAAGKQ
jgi:hypothetical protein